MYISCCTSCLSPLRPPAPPWGLILGEAPPMTPSSIDLLCFWGLQNSWRSQCPRMAAVTPSSVVYFLFNIHFCWIESIGFVTAWYCEQYHVDSSSKIALPWSVRGKPVW